jgi:hypothetical protein
MDAKNVIVGDLLCQSMFLYIRMAAYPSQVMESLSWIRYALSKINRDIENWFHLVKPITKSKLAFSLKSMMNTSL